MPVCIKNCIRQSPFPNPHTSPNWSNFVLYLTFKPMYWNANLCVWDVWDLGMRMQYLNFDIALFFVLSASNGAVRLNAV